MIFERSIQQASKQRYSTVELFSTEGRIGRQSYFVYSITLPFSLLLVLASITGLISKLGSSVAPLSYTLLAISFIAVLLFVVHLTIQRCHDFNVNGIFALLAMIPFANIIFALIPGNNGLNSYGEAPEPESNIIKSATVIISIILAGLVSYAAFYFYGTYIKPLLIF